MATKCSVQCKIFQLYVLKECTQYVFPPFYLFFKHTKAKVDPCLNSLCVNIDKETSIALYLFRFFPSICSSNSCFLNMLLYMFQLCLSHSLDVL